MTNYGKVGLVDCDTKGQLTGGLVGCNVLTH